MTSLLEHFHIPPNSLLMTGTYEPWLVILSILLAIFTSFMALQTMAQAQHMPAGGKRAIAYITAGISQGGGVWSMHFIGMLAFTLHTPVHYNWGLTFLSMLPSIVACWLTMLILNRPTIRFSQLLLGGILVGAGIGCMHYMGMEAMEMAPLLRYDPFFFALSIVVAVSLATLALWIRFGVQQIRRVQLSETSITLICAVVMGCAVSGMHYTGMSAARFVHTYTPHSPAEFSQHETLLLAIGVAVTTIIISGFVQAVYLALKFRDLSQQARTSESRLRVLNDTAVDGIITFDANGLIINTNQAVSNILGRQREAMLGKPIACVLPQPFSLPSEKHTLLEQIKAHTQGIELEVTAPHSSGRSIPLRLAVGHTLLADESFYVAFISDISKRLAIETALKENEEQFRSLVENIPGIAYRCLNTPEWPMLFISDAVETLTGYPASDFRLPNAKRTFADLYHPDEKQALCAFTHPEDEYTLEYRLIRQDGSIRWVLENGHYIRDGAGEIMWIDGFIMDITERKLMEEAIIQAKNKAEAAAAARSQFLANMSHEIRTPMNSILGFCEVLAATELDSSQQSYLKSIHSSSRSLLHLLNDILDSAKLDKGKIELEYATFCLHQKLESVVSSFWLQAQKKNLTLHLQLDPNLQPYYRGVPERLRQVLTNLIGNAIKFTEKGSVTVSVTPDPVSGDVRFCIADTGIGIPPEQLTNIFEPFIQADASITRRYGGTGLGTTISKQLVELMGGKIWAESQENIGSRFCFSLPLPAAESPVPESTPATAAMALPPLSILVVDDLQQNRDLLSILLKKSGHRVTLANQGAEALQKFQEESFAVVLMDVQMPVMDGHTATRKIREYEKQQQLLPTPIIALTASVRQEDKLAASEAGMDGFASKPVEYPLLTAEIHRLLFAGATAISSPPEPPPIKTDAAETDNTPTRDDSLLDLPFALKLWDNLHTYISQLDTFLTNNATVVDDLRQHLSHSQYDAAAHIAHSGSGVSGNLAMKPLSQAFSALESALKQQQVDCLESHLQQIESLLGKAAGALQQLQEQASSAPADGPASPTGSILSCIEHLIRAAENNQVNDLQLRDLTALAAPEQRYQCSRITAAFHDFEFQQAIDFLHEFRQQLPQRG